MSREAGEKKLDELEKKLGYAFSDRRILVKSLTHPSYAHEQAQAREHKNPDPALTQEHYERLEFLGDAVLDLVISHLLMEKFGDTSEGDLSRMRASLVNSEKLAQLAEKIRLDRFVLLGKGEEAAGGNKKHSILADVYEAVIGGVYLDGGFDAAFRTVNMHFRKLIEKAGVNMQWRDYKTEVQEKIQALYKKTPTYRVVREKGPEHKKSFEVELRLGSKVLGKGRGGSKKEAEQQAAKAVLQKGKLQI